MGTSERLHRPDPERTAPLRHASTYLRDAPAGDAADAAAADAADSTVAHGVRLGYKVIEEQILQGQRLAQRLARPSDRPAAAAGSSDAGQLIDRVLHLYKEIGTLCIDAVGTLARNPALRAGLARAAQPASGEAEAASVAHPAAAAGFAVEVSSARRTRVTLDLSLLPGRFAPRVHALHAADPALPPLVAVSFDTDPLLPEPMLRVDVPAAQPAGTYTGVVVDAASNEPRGTVSVRLLP